MPSFEIVSLILSAIFGTGGIVALYKVRKNTQVGMSGVEVQDKAMKTADWDALSKYWQSEMAAMRTQVAGLETKVDTLESERRKDADERAAERKRNAAERDLLLEEINIRDRWIWEGKPPPPPPRRQLNDPNP